MIDDPLAALRPLHEPLPIGWWPPAPGWWIVALLIAACLLLVYRYRKNRVLQRAALNELVMLSKHCNTIDQPVAQLNQLLKRYALVCWPAEKVASLSGQSWVDFLDATGGNGKFSEGAGGLLMSGPYRQEQVDMNELIKLAHHWIKTNTPNKISHV